MSLSHNHEAAHERPRLCTMNWQSDLVRCLAKYSRLSNQIPIHRSPSLIPPNCCLANLRNHAWSLPMRSHRPVSSPTNRGTSANHRRHSNAGRNNVLSATKLAGFGSASVRPSRIQATPQSDQVSNRGAGFRRVTPTTTGVVPVRHGSTFPHRVMLSAAWPTGRCCRRPMFVPLSLEA
jgi:hypothetical protein